LEARADRSIDAHVALFTQASRSNILFEYPDEWWDGVALSAPLTSEVLGVEKPRVAVRGDSLRGIKWVQAAACASACAKAPSASSIAPSHALPETASRNLSGAKIGLKISSDISRARRRRSGSRLGGGCRSAVRPLRLGQRAFSVFARVLCGREDRVCGVGLFLVREVDAGHDALQEAPGEDGELGKNSWPKTGTAAAL
jgi:hypothetical protein